MAMLGGDRCFNNFNDYSLIYSKASSCSFVATCPAGFGVNGNMDIYTPCGDCFIMRSIPEGCWPCETETYNNGTSSMCDDVCSDTIVGANTCRGGTYCQVSRNTISSEYKQYI
jgi:hypothetical protein